MSTPTPSRSAAPPAGPWRAYLAWTVLGLGFASASTWTHYQLLRTPDYASVCDVSATVSCTTAYTSQFGSLAGVPIALLGMLFFAAVTGVVLLCRSSASAAPHLSSYVFTLSSIGLAFVLYLAYASFVVLQTVCLLCVGTYVAVLALFITSGRAVTGAMSSMPGEIASDLRTLLRSPAALAAVLVFFGGSVAALAVFPSQAGLEMTDRKGPSHESASAALSEPFDEQGGLSPPARQELETWLGQQQRVTLDLPKSGAAVTVVKFNDYQCPPCRETYMQLKPMFAKLEKERPGQVAYVTKDFALEPECNSELKQDLHPAACEAAVAVRLARANGRAVAMEEWLFANQPTLTGDAVRTAAQKVAGVSDFAERYPGTLEAVKRDIAEGQKLGVRGTPTFFLNGIRVPAWPPEVFEAAIAAELKRLGR